MLRWQERDWVQQFVAMQLELAEHVGVAPVAIEIHPGSPPNEIDQILAGARALMDAFADRSGQAPLILLENRTGQVVSDGRDHADEADRTVHAAAWADTERGAAGVPYTRQASGADDGGCDTVDGGVSAD